MLRIFDWKRRNTSTFASTRGISEELILRWCAPGDYHVFSLIPPVKVPSSWSRTWLFPFLSFFLSFFLKKKILEAEISDSPLWLASQALGDKHRDSSSWRATKLIADFIAAQPFFSSNCLLLFVCGHTWKGTNEVNMRRLVRGKLVATDYLHRYDSFGWVFHQP